MSLLSRCIGPLLISLTFLILATAAAPAGEERAAGWVRQSARQIPLAARVDVVVVGGNTWCVGAAVAAAEQGASVLLVAPRSYLGEDLCATLRLELAEGQTPSDPLARRCFGDGRRTTPLRVKKALDAALLDAKVRFLHGCYSTDVLRDATGDPAGIVIANRAGRQAVVARVIIDGTDRAWVARQAGARSRPWPGDEITSERVTILQGDLPLGKAVVHHLDLPVPDGRFASLAAAEQAARDATYTEGQLRAAESLFQVPPDPIVARRGPDPWRGNESLAVGHFQPLAVERLYVLSGCADIPREAAAQLLQPGAMIPIGRRIGAAAGAEAKKLAAPEGVHLPGGGRNVASAAAAQTGDIRETLVGLRPSERPRETVPAEAGQVPVLGDYDVVVVGGGTAGAPAAIAAARRGARTIVLEYQEALGGIGTVGLVTRPYHGLAIGFTKEVPFPDTRHNVEHKMEWYRREVRKAGGKIWFGVLGCGALVHGNRVEGVVVATPEGRGVIRARCVVDATGSADVAAAAGAETIFGGGDNDIALQGTGAPPRPLAATGVNTDYLLVDESDMLDTWSTLVGVRLAMSDGHFDAGPMIQNRERRQVVGEHVLRYVDQIAERTYADSVVLSASDYDVHGYPLAPYFALFPHDARTLKANHPAPGGRCYTPYRCLLPRELDRILVAGVGISMDRDASAMIRMQRDIQNQGYAAGVAAAVVAASSRGTREIDIRALQAHLVEIGNLPGEVLDHRDSFPLPAEEVRSAVETVARSDRRPAACKALAIVLAHREAALPLLREAFQHATGDKRLVYARILGFQGERQVVPALLEALERTPGWDSKVYQGTMAEYAYLPTPTDSLILALGATRDARALPSLLNRLSTLDVQVTLSHHRAVAGALEQIGDPAAARPLADLLARPGMSGHAMTEVVPLPEPIVKRRDRTPPLREISLARALYRCGDWDGVGGRILRQYQRDLRGLFARHATAVLATPPGKRPE